MRQISCLPLFQLIMLIAFSGISCMKPPQRDPYTINDDMAELKWAQWFTAIDADTVRFFPVKQKFLTDKIIEYYRQVKPGTILHLDLFSALQPFSKSLTMPDHYTFDIPVRQINGKYGKLKAYEKDFLLTYLATNLRAKFSSVPADTSLIRLWNFVMNNLWLVKDAKPNAIIKAKVDYRKVTTELLNHDPSFSNQISSLDGTFQGLVLQRTNVPLISGYFHGELQGTVITNQFYDKEKGDRTFSFVSFTTIVDGAYYNRNLSIRELSTWSVYDWIHSGVPMYEGDKKSLKRIVFKSTSGRYKILYDNTTPGRSVYYNSGSIELEGSGDKKTIREEDLQNIFPSSVKRLIFK